MSSRQPIVSAADAEFPLFLGVDVGGTSIKIGLVDSRGQTLAFDEIPTHEPDGGEQAIERAAETFHATLEKLGIWLNQVARIGLGTPGSMDIAKGLMLEPPNHPHWKNFPVRDYLSKAAGLPVSFVNDANAAAFGEFWMGSGVSHQSLVMLTLGTGVGGGVIVDGTLVNGVNSFGSECGHVVVDSRPDARLCVWGGGQGQLEAYASASAVVEITLERLRNGEPSTLAVHLDGKDPLTAKKIHEAAEQDDNLALAIIDQTAYYLGIGVTSLVHTIDPGLVVLGGAMDFGGTQSKVGSRFLAGVSAEFQRRTFSNVFAGTTIKFATLGADAGYIGAAGVGRADYLAAKERLPA